MKLGGDLTRGAAALEEVENLRLAGREWKLGMCVRCLDEVGDLPEHADDILTASEGTELISTATRSPPEATSTNLASVTVAAPTTFRAKSSRARRVCSGWTTFVKWRPSTFPTIFCAAGLSQRMIPVRSTT
jgi:hypothetical protein